VPYYDTMPHRQRSACMNARSENEAGLTCKCPHCRSVPSGRVGSAKDATFRSNEGFREAVRRQEEADVSVLETRLSHVLDKGERARIGVSQLRRFLEQLLQRR